MSTGPSEESRAADIRQDLRLAVLAAERAAYAAEELLGCGGELDKKRAKRGRHAMFGLRHSAQDALKHPISLVGYLDGFEARSAERLRLEGAAPALDASLAVPHQLEQIRKTCLLVHGALQRVLDRPSLAPAAKGPKIPGPERTAQVAAEHLRSLALQVPGSIAAMAGTMGLRSQAEGIALETERLLDEGTGTT